MTDPTSSNILLAEPTRGSDSGTWDVPVNGNMTALDGILGGNSTISLAAATTLTLSAPATGTVSATAGPNQSQNAVIKFTGTLTGNAVIKLTLPRKYVFDNQCTVATSYIQIAPASGTGTAIGLPPGEKTEVNYDGTNVDFVGLGRVGSFLDLAVSTTQPWMSACSTLPYLVSNGATYSTSVYPALGAMLGSTFGGNGITTFGVPDVAGRVRAMLNAGTGRLTAGGSGVNGDTLGAAGGNELIQAHTHTATVTDPGHSHFVGVFNGGGAVPGSNGIQGTANANNTNTPGGQALTGPTGITVANATTGAGGAQNVQPTIIFGVTFIKT